MRKKLTQDLSIEKIWHYKENYLLKKYKIGEKTDHKSETRNLNFENKELGKKLNQILESNLKGFESTHLVPIVQKKIVSFEKSYFPIKNLSLRNFIPFNLYFVPNERKKVVKWVQNLMLSKKKRELETETEIMTDLYSSLSKLATLKGEKYSAEIMFDFVNGYVLNFFEENEFLMEHRVDLNVYFLRSSSFLFCEFKLEIFWRIK